MVEPLLDVDRLQQLDLALEGEVGPPAGDVGQGAGVLDVAEHLGEPATAELVEQGGHGRADSRASSRARSVGSVSSTGSLPTQSAAVVPITPAPTWARAVARTTRAGVPSGSVPRFSIVGDGPDPAVAAVEAGDEQDLAGLAGGLAGGLGLVGLEGDGHDHLGEHDTRWRGAVPEGSALSRSVPSSCPGSRRSAM